MAGLFGLFAKPKINGKKTYIIVLAVLVLGALEALGIFTLPGWVIPILGALGLGSVRHAIEKAKKASEEAMKVASKK